MIITILTGSDELNYSLERYINHVFPEKVEEVYLAKLGNPQTLEPEMFNTSHLWIIEAFNPEDYKNPEGFRTAKKVVEKSRVLLLFIRGDLENFPDEGKFWLVLPSKISIISKLKEIFNQHSFSLKDLLELEEKWVDLKREPSNHHHRNVKFVIHEE